MKIPFWSPAPPDVTGVQRRNFINVQIDGIAIGLSSAAAQFLPVFLTRLGASNFQVGLLTSMPAFTGLFLALAVGRFLQTRRQVVPWYSLSRLMVVSAYAATGLVTLLVPAQYRIITVLVIWAIATLPQTMVAVAFSVVMNAVAGPARRYELMSRRWSVLGLTTAIAGVLVGQVLYRIDFPFNYQVVFMGLSLAGLVSFYYSRRIELPDAEPPTLEPGLSLRQRLGSYSRLVLGEKDFVRFALIRFVFLSGTMLAAPLFPLYFVREVQANDAWIGFINTAQTFVLIVGYSWWSRTSRRRGSRFVLLWTTLGMGLYPVLVASTHNVALIALFAAVAGIFQAGLDLVFFDELMRTVPEKYSATFVSLAQSLQYTSSLAAPLLGTLLADSIGISGALLISAGLRLAGFLLFLLWGVKPKPEVHDPEHEQAAVDAYKASAVTVVVADVPEAEGVEEG